MPEKSFLVKVKNQIKPYNKTILDYEKNGWVIVKNFFKKKEIEEIKNKYLKKYHLPNKIKIFTSKK